MTEFIVIGTPTMRDKLSEFFPADLLRDPFTPQTSAKSLGFVFDSDLNLSSHISGVNKACYLGIWNISRVRRYLNKKALILLSKALASRKLGYCNALFSSLPARELGRL